MLSGFLTSGRRLEADDLKSGYMARVKYFLFNNKMRVFLCQAAFTLVLMFISIPLVSRGFYLAIKLSGFSSVTKENFFDVLKKPGTIVYICLLILLVMIFMLLNLTMFVVMFDSELRHRRKGLVGYLIQVEKHFFPLLSEAETVAAPVHDTVCACSLSAAAFDAAESQSGYKIYAENLHPGGRQSTVLVRRNPAVHYLYYDNDCKISTDTLPDSWQCGSRKSSGKDKAVCS